MKLRKCLLPITISIVLLGTAEPHAQGLLGDILNKAISGVRQHSQNDGPNETETYVLDFSLTGNQLVFNSQTPGEQVIGTRGMCIASLASEQGDALQGSSPLSKYLFANSINASPLSRGNIFLSNEYIVQNTTVGRQKTDLYTLSCGPVSLAGGSPVDSTAIGSFASVGVDTNVLVQDAEAYVQDQNQQRTAAAKQKTAEDANQAKLDVLYLYANAFYAPNGIMSNMSADDLSPFHTAEECRANVTARIKTGLHNSPGTRLAGESVILTSDGTGSIWMGCVTVKAMDGAAEKYLDIQMTDAKAKTMKLIPIYSFTYGIKRQSQKYAAHPAQTDNSGNNGDILAG